MEGGLGRREGSEGGGPGTEADGGGGVKED
jgi:hypothetical protein